MTNNGKFLAGLATGLGVGAILGMLIAPDKGSETYRKIEGAVRDAANDLMEFSNEALNSAKNEAQAVKNN